MKVIEHQRFDTGISEMPLHGVANDRQILLVQHLVGFEVKGPVARALGLGQHLLLSVHEARDPHGLVPVGIDDADARIANGLQGLAGAIVRGTERDHIFIGKRQGRTDALDKRVTEAYAIAQKSEETDFHGLPAEPLAALSVALPPDSAARWYRLA